MNKRKFGQSIEKLAEDYLKTQGLKPLDNNYADKEGEIDLIMQDQQTIVFVEVRFRKTMAYGGALASISLEKQKRIIKTAKRYLLKKKLYDKVFCRFDIITAQNTQGNLALNWYQNAFLENFV